MSTIVVDVTWRKDQPHFELGIPTTRSRDDRGFQALEEALAMLVHRTGGEIRVRWIKPTRGEPA